MLVSKGVKFSQCSRPFRKNIAKEGDSVIFALGKNVVKFIKLRSGAVTQSRCGAIKHDDVIGKPYGSRVRISL